MASIIKADTLQSTTSNVFVLNSAGTEYARFDSDGDLAIGTASPDSKLHILNSAGASLRIGYLGGNTNYYDATTHTFRSANGSPSSFISNQYGIGLASTVPSSGVGIAFPSTQTASSDANTLDDYEEGTWSAVVTGESGSITAYAINSATYTKTGDTVHVYVRFTVSNKGTGSNFVVSGLPFTSARELLGIWAETNLLGLTGLMFTAGTGATSFTSRLGGNWAGQCLANGSYTVQTTYRVQ